MFINGCCHDKFFLQHQLDQTGPILLKMAYCIDEVLFFDNIASTLAIPSLVPILIANSGLSPSANERVDMICLVFFRPFGICFMIFSQSSNELAPATLSTHVKIKA